MDFPSFCFNTIKTSINGLRYHYKAACVQGSNNFLSCFRCLGDKFYVQSKKTPEKQVGSQQGGLEPSVSAADVPHAGQAGQVVAGRIQNNGFNGCGYACRDDERYPNPESFLNGLVSGFFLVRAFGCERTCQIDQKKPC